MKYYYNFCFCLFISIFFHIFLFIIFLYLIIKPLKKSFFIDRSISVQLFDTSAFYKIHDDNSSIHAPVNHFSKIKNKKVLNQGGRKLTIKCTQKKNISDVKDQATNLVNNVCNERKKSDIIVIPQAIVRVNPIYPEKAKLSGIEGQVVVLYNINIEGKVENIRISSSYPSGIFEHVVKSAMRRWVYEINYPVNDLILTFNFCLINFN